MASSSLKGETAAVEVSGGLKTPAVDQLSVGGLKKARRERVCTAKDRISRMPPCAAGAYDDEEAAARAYDLAALKYWGAGTLINFPVSDYSRDLEEMQMVSKEDYLVSLRRGHGNVIQSTRQKISAESSEAMEEPIHPTKPYQFPILGLSQKGKSHTHSISACDILSRSVAFKNFENKLKGSQDGSCSKQMELQKSTTLLFTDGGIDRSGASLDLSEFPVQRAPYSLAPLLSAPLRTNWNPVDPVPDPVFWASLIPPTAQSLP
ncbi:hypothetical protein J5N97_025101 [Dioscorea zingiberensis]|uniref:AP2/ERF domain-containing protein n=1 Tax=Dioscorea zingiberensis TaxID=325984 RepID=A0A9D5C848_9LILI|nr:hypothetical protein J5N97_025101 [Dioscorea zingiberensis]